MGNYANNVIFYVRHVEDLEKTNVKVVHRENILMEVDVNSKIYGNKIKGSAQMVNILTVAL